MEEGPSKQVSGWLSCMIPCKIENRRDGVSLVMIPSLQRHTDIPCVSCVFCIIVSRCTIYLSIYCIHSIRIHTSYVHVCAGRMDHCLLHLLDTVSLIIRYSHSTRAGGDVAPIDSKYTPRRFLAKGQHKERVCYIHRQNFPFQ